MELFWKFSDFFYFKCGLCDADDACFSYNKVWRNTSDQQLETNHVKMSMKGSGDHYMPYQNLLKVSEQTRLLDLRNAFYSRTKTKSEQAMWLVLEPCEVIYLVISLLNISYHFSVPVIINAVIFLYGFYINILKFFSQYLIGPFTFCTC